MKKRVFVGIFLIMLVGMLTVLFRLQVANTDVSTLSISARLTQAEGFLERLYNPSMGLCRETLVGDNPHEVDASNGTSYARLTDETYWIASDNLLDSQALEPYNLTLSENISQTCSRYYNGSYFPYQIINGSYIPLTLHVPNTYVLENTSDHITALNLYNGTVDCSNYLDYPTSGDALVYEALNYFVQGYPLNWSIGLYMRAYGMFDGKGVADAHFQNTGQYDNMKLALLIFGARALNLTVDLTEVEQQLWAAQETNGTEVGGFTSVMLSSGLPNGTANGETTALTLLAYDNNMTGQFLAERDAAIPKPSINATFPAATFNQTQFLNTSLIAIPLLDNWSVTVNNTLVWENSSDNPRAGIGFYSSLADRGNLSIQIIEYNNSAMDVVIHNATYPDGFPISPAGLNWLNPLTVSHVSGNLSISGSNGLLFTCVFQSFNLTYITGGSTEADICSGGEVGLQIGVIPSATVHNLNTGLNYTTIQEAIDANETLNGQTIRVDAGTYYEPITVTKSLALIGEDRNTTIIDGNGIGVLVGFHSATAVIAVRANYVKVSNFTVRNAGFHEGRSDFHACVTCLVGQHNIDVENNTLQNAGRGIVLGSVSQANISNNDISNIAGYGIDVGISCTNVTLGNNYIQDYGVSGINVDGDTRHCQIINNTVKNGPGGIDLNRNEATLLFPVDNLIAGNTLSNNSVANLIILGTSDQYQEYFTNTFRRNNLTNIKQHNLIVWGDDLAFFMQDIDGSNTANNKRIYYLTNRSNLEIDPSTLSDAGSVALVNCTDVTVKDFDFSGNNDGMLLVGSTGCTMTNITLANNRVYLVGLETGSHPSNYGGLTLFNSSNNTIVDSRIYNNTCGICLCRSDWNMFYHNAFIGNDKPVISDLYDPFENVSSGIFSRCSWNDSLEGNFWSDYNGTDLYSGPYQNETGSDGIGDTPYAFDASNKDSHPLIGPFSSFNTQLGNVCTISNSTISNLSLPTWLSSPYDGLEPGQTFMQFLATGQNGSVGFCRLMFPRIALNSSSYIVMVDSVPIHATQLPMSNSTDVYLYFTYTHSTHEVIVTIPEFPSIIIPPLFMLFTLLATVIMKRRDLTTHVEKARNCCQTPPDFA